MLISMAKIFTDIWTIRQSINICDWKQNDLRIDLQVEIVSKNN